MLVARSSPCPAGVHERTLIGESNDGQMRKTARLDSSARLVMFVYWKVHHVRYVQQARPVSSALMTDDLTLLLGWANVVILGIRYFMSTAGSADACWCCFWREQPVHACPTHMVPGCFSIVYLATPLTH